MEPTQLVIEYIPLCVQMRGGSGYLRMALQESPTEGRPHPYRELGLADGHSLVRVSEKFGSVSGSAALLCVSESEGQIVHTFVHVIPLIRRNGSVLSAPKLDGLVWYDATRLLVQGFLRRELLVECRLPCLFLPNEWTAMEYRLVCEAILGLRRDPSNTRTAVERMVRDKLVTHTGRQVPTLTRPARSYSALDPSALELHGSPWRRMDSERPKETP